MFRCELRQTTLQVFLHGNGQNTFLYQGQTLKVNAARRYVRGSCDSCHESGICTKKELAFRCNRPTLTIPPRPGSGSSGQSVPGILPLPKPTGPPLIFWGFFSAITFRFPQLSVPVHRTPPSLFSPAFSSLVDPCIALFVRENLNAGSHPKLSFPRHGARQKTSFPSSSSHPAMCPSHRSLIARNKSSHPVRPLAHPIQHPLASHASESKEKAKESSFHVPL